MMEIERRGKCDLEDVEREPCPVPNLLQFHDRYLTYLIAAREREMHQDFRVESWTYEDRRAVIEWEFTNQDKNGNGILDKEEIEAMMIPDEDCMIGFLKSCDYDHQPGISRAEWATCFPPMVPELSEEDVQS